MTWTSPFLPLLSHVFYLSPLYHSSFQPLQLFVETHSFSPSLPECVINRKSGFESCFQPVSIRHRCHVVYGGCAAISVCMLPPVTLRSWVLVPACLSEACSTKSSVTLTSHDHLQRFHVDVEITLLLCCHLLCE